MCVGSAYFADVLHALCVYLPLCRAAINNITLGLGLMCLVAHFSPSAFVKKRSVDASGVPVATVHGWALVRDFAFYAIIVILLIVFRWSGHQKLGLLRAGILSIVYGTVLSRAFSCRPSF